MSDLELYKDAILTVDLPADGLRTGDVGAVVERHQVSVVTVGACKLRAPTSADLPSVRELSTTSE